MRRTSDSAHGTKIGATGHPVIRGGQRELHLSTSPVCHAENGQRSVPLEKTITNIERFFLSSQIEVQFAFFNNLSEELGRAILKYHSPSDSSHDQHYFGKGLTRGQNIASACFEFFERYCAWMRPDDLLTEASFDEVSDRAIDPRLFNLGDSPFSPSATIDWIWGYSLSRKRPVLVPANLVFLPYRTNQVDRHIVLADSNGIAAGNTIEEAILHALLEVVERDQVNICEFNRFPFQRIAPDSVPEACQPMLRHLEAGGFQAHLLLGHSDIPIPFMAVFLQHKAHSSNCSVAFGCYQDPTLALERALTEAVQMLPPSVNHEAWLTSGAPQFYQSRFSDEIDFSSIGNTATPDIRENIERCVSFLNNVGSEVLVVDLSQPDIPFPAVRVLATQLQPRLNPDSLRFSKRFFDVPAKLGFGNRPATRSEVALWSICGYR